MKHNVVGISWVMLTVLLTVYGQLIWKWKVDDAGDLPAGTAARLEYVGRVFVNPWILSAFAALLVAAAAWTLALKYLDLSEAYPLTSLSFVLVLLLSGVFFGEPVTALKIVGVLLIAGGLVVATAF